MSIVLIDAPHMSILIFRVKCLLVRSLRFSSPCVFSRRMRLCIETPSRFCIFVDFPSIVAVFVDCIWLKGAVGLLFVLFCVC